MHLIYNINFIILKIIFNLLMNCCVVEIKEEKIYTPKPIRMSKNNYFNFKKINTPVQKKKLEDISIEEIDNDFKLLKSKSEEKLCKEDFLEVLSLPITRPDSNELNYRKERCSNPFYKNFENEDEDS